MESRRILDAARRACFGAIILFSSSNLRAQGGEPADLLYQRGMAAAQEQRWDRARADFLAGARAYPEDARFATELGGIAYKQGDFRGAASWLRRAVRPDPADSYAADFLGTIYYLQENVEAAVKYWNLAGKPRIHELKTQDGLRVDPVLLDRAFTFSPGETLALDRLRETNARLKGLGIFGASTLRLNALPSGEFDAQFIATERNGFGEGWLGAAATTLRGIGYRALRPEYANIGGRAVSVESLIRWDPDKRRLAADLGGPFQGNPQYRFRIGLDLRDENWSLRAGAVSSLGAVQLQKKAVTAGVTSVGDRTWSLAGEFSHRDLSRLAAWRDAPGYLFDEGFQAKLYAGTTQPLWRAPEHRFTSHLRIQSETSRLWSGGSRAYEKLQAGIVTEWNPRMRGSDYTTRFRVQAGQTLGRPPFDELFILGLERDNDLLMRAHIGTRGGRKGSAPMGRRYFVANWEIDKTVYDAGLWSIALSPFFDTGKTDASVGLGSRAWLFDTGIQAKLRVLGVGFTFVYGKDLRSGANTFYALDRAR